MKKLQENSLDNILKLFAKRLDDFNGESRRSYQKAYSSFQLYLLQEYPLSMSLESHIIENWVIDNYLKGLTPKTVSFYLDKISSLYTAISPYLISGKTRLFKDIKLKLKNHSDSPHFLLRNKNLKDKIISLLKDYPHTTNFSTIKDVVLYSLLNGGIELKEIIKEKKKEIRSLLNHNKEEKVTLKILIEELGEAVIEFLKSNHLPVLNTADDSLRYIWANLALNSSVPASVIKNLAGSDSNKISLLNICNNHSVDESTKQKSIQTVVANLTKGKSQWFAMKLRPKVKYENLLERFGKLTDGIRMPELFYPYEEIAKKIGRRLVWKDQPVIRDVVFFKMYKEDVHSLFSQIYDLAWCYRTPGVAEKNYAVIPQRAMDDFKRALGFLGPEFEVAPSGEMNLNPGDEVIIVNGEYANELAKILKTSPESEKGNKIFRVSLLNRNGHWDIGIDARLLKKT